MSVFTRREIKETFQSKTPRLDVGVGRYNLNEKIRKEPLEPMLDEGFRKKFREGIPEKDSKGHDVTKMRTTDPIDHIQVKMEGVDMNVSPDLASAVDNRGNNKTFNGGNTRCPILRPFGPSVAEFMVRDDIHQMSKDIVNHVYENEYQDYSQHLAGVVEEEGYLPSKYWFPSGVAKYFEDAVSMYLIESIACSMLEGHVVSDKLIEAQLDSKPKVQTNAAWFNVMRENEYNPVHYHTNCDVSGVYYINVPQMKRREEIKYGQDAMDGNILLIDNNNNPQMNFCMGHVSKSPKEGMCYLFPSFMQHTVYPFRGDGERISISFNFSVEWGDKEVDPMVAARYRSEVGPIGDENPVHELQQKRAGNK
jgi:hypothetical protein